MLMNIILKEKITRVYESIKTRDKDGVVPTQTALNAVKTLEIELQAAEDRATHLKAELSYARVHRDLVLAQTLAPHAQINKMMADAIIHAADVIPEHLLERPIQMNIWMRQFAEMVRKDEVEIDHDTN